jgi:hypothetical protein
MFQDVKGHNGIETLIMKRKAPLIIYLDIRRSVNIHPDVPPLHPLGQVPGIVAYIEHVSFKVIRKQPANFKQFVLAPMKGRLS